MGEKLRVVRRVLYGLTGLIALLLSLAVLSAANRSPKGPEIKSHQRPVHANHAQEPAQTEPSEAAGAHSSIPSVLSPSGHREGKAEAEQGRENGPKGEGGFLGTPLNAEAVIAIFTILLFAATFALYLATRDLVKGADETARRQLRPYVVLKPFIHKCNCNPITKVVENWEFRSVWHNVGSTPTKHMVTRVGMLKKCSEVPLDFASEAAGMQPGEPGRLFLGPGNEGASEKFAVPVTEMLAAMFDGLQIYLWGCADYNDTFSKTPRHRTEFCVRIVIVGDPQSPDCGIGYVLHGPFNGFDDECTRQPDRYDPGSFR